MILPNDEQSNTFENFSQTVMEYAEQKPKSNKKKIIFSLIITVAVICIIAIIISISNKRDSLWKKPFDEDAFTYGYKVTPDEFINKANELYIDDVHHEFEYGQKEAIDGIEQTAERYCYDISSFELYGRPAYYSECGVDYYKDKTIRQTILVFDYKDVFSFDWAYDDLCVSAVQILYAYGAFETDSASYVLNKFKSYSDVLESIAEERRVNIFFKYDGFVLNLLEGENSDALYFRIQKTDEKGIEKIENSSGPLVSLENDSSVNEKEKNVTGNETMKKSNQSKSKKSPEDCFVNTKKIYEQVKPFFMNYGYDFDAWEVTVDSGDMFIAETDSEIVALQDTSLNINLNKDGSQAKGLQVFGDSESANSIQIWLGGSEKNMAYELLDVIFEGVYVNDRKISEYIESEYKSHLNEGNVSNWSNGTIKYTVQFNDDLIFVMISRK